MNHDHLQAKYERNPEQYVVEFFNPTSLTWKRTIKPLWCPTLEYRLRPIIPEASRHTFIGIDMASDCDYTVIWEGLAKEMAKDWFTFPPEILEAHAKRAWEQFNKSPIKEKSMDTESINRLITNTAALSGALAQAGGDPERILDRDEVRDLLRTLARNNIELRAVYSGKRGAS